MTVLLGVVSGTGAKDDSTGHLPAKAESEAVVMEEIACPFELGDAEQERVDEILERWEERSRSIRSFSCKFTRRQYVTALSKDFPLVAQGEITYRWPSKASY
ncbi:MAG TPA: hypothetical protein VG125_12385, partial [Pirellulales bacterium]|nr:hypothetical protein [Pirellulales bacterium]